MFVGCDPGKTQILQFVLTCFSILISLKFGRHSDFHILKIFPIAKQVHCRIVVIYLLSVWKYLKGINFDEILCLHLPMKVNSWQQFSRDGSSSL